MKGFLAIMKSVLRRSARERTALFFTMLLPIFFMVIFGLIFGGNGITVKIGIADEDHTALSATFIKALKDQPEIQITEGSKSDLLDQLNHDQQAIVAVLPKGFSTAITTATAPAATITLYQQQSAQTTSAIAQSVIGQFAAGFSSHTAPRVGVATHQVSGQTVRVLDWMLPSMIAYIVLQAGINFVAIGLVDLRERKVLRRFLVTPLRPIQILAGEILGRAVLVILQIIILIFVGLIAFGVHINGSWLVASTAMLIGTATFVSIGFLLTSFAKTSEAARGMSAAIAFPMMFLSGVFFPLNEMPTGMQTVVHILPLTYLSDALHQVLNNAAGFSAIVGDLSVLSVWTVVAFTIASLRFRWE